MAKSGAKRINLALQGGGAHGAFTWGVLDRLLECEEIEIAGISGTSAGALNGAALKAGMISDGRLGARANLDWLWGKVGAVDNSLISPWMTVPQTEFLAQTMEYSPALAVTDFWSRIVSPYSYGALYRNPLKPIVDAFNFDQICAADGPALFIGATHVRTGKLKIFSGQEIGTNAVLASACLPTLFKAVEVIDPVTGKGEAYWDGGYTGNPALFPLFDQKLPADIVIVNVNPLERNTVPVTAQQIQNRISEISFNASLFRELRAITYIQGLMEDGTLTSDRKSRVLLHMIADDTLMNDLSAATKVMPNPIILSRLKEAGRIAGDQFLDNCWDDLNACSTITFPEMQL